MENLMGGRVREGRKEGTQREEGGKRTSIWGGNYGREEREYGWYYRGGSVHLKRTMTSVLDLDLWYSLHYLYFDLLFIGLMILEKLFIACYSILPQVQ